MKKSLMFVGAVILAATLAFAELGGTTVSATSTAATTTISGASLVVANDGADEIYVRVFSTGEVPDDAVAGTSREIKSGEIIEFHKDFGITAISIVCDTGETATVRLFFW